MQSERITLTRAAVIVLAAVLAAALVSCTSAQQPASTPPAVKPAVEASATPASVPALRIVGLADKDSIESGGKLKSGYTSLMTGQSVVSVEETASADPLVPDGTEFILTLDAAGAGSFARITSDRVGHRIAFVVDGIVLDAPTIEDPVPDGVIIIITPTPALTSLLQGAVKPR